VQGESLPEFFLGVHFQACLWPCIMDRPWPCVLSKLAPGLLGRMLYAALSLAPYPGLTLASCCSLVFSLISGHVCFCSRLDSMEGPWTPSTTCLSVPIDGPHYQNLALPAVFISCGTGPCW